MPVVSFICRGCNKPQSVDVSQGQRVLKFGENAPVTYVVRCPQCQTENSIQLPPKKN